MARKINERGSIITIDPSEKFFVRHMIPDGIECLAKVEPLENGFTKITPNVGVIAIVEGLHESLGGCKHIRFIRKSRGGTFNQLAASWPRLRVALRYAGVPTVHAVGGMDCNIVVFDDEIAVRDHSCMGSRGWIIPRADIGKYLEALPPLQDSGVLKALWIESVGWANTPDEFWARVFSEDPTAFPSAAFYDRGRGQEVSTNRQICRLEYDAGSGIVKKIADNYTGEELVRFIYDVRPSERAVVVGRRLPTKFAELG